MSDETSVSPPPLVPAKRLRATDLVEQLVHALTRTSSERSSVTLTRNARGITQIEVTVRTGETGVTTVAEARDRARAEYDRLCRLYPAPDVNGNGA